MASTELSMHVEMEIIYDVIGELGRVHRALVHYHGDKYRKMERRIEKFATEFPPPILCHLGDCRYIAQSPDEISSLLRQAREWGVI